MRKLSKKIEKLLKKIEKLLLARHNAEIAIEDGRSYLALYRDTETSDTDICPFCGSNHHHGTSDGHRVAQCGGYDFFYKEMREIIGDNSFFYNKDGIKFENNKGYCVVTRYPNNSLTNP